MSGVPIGLPADARSGAGRRLGRCLVFAGLAAILGCGAQQQPQPVAPPSGPAATRGLTGRVEVVDLRDKPLPGMVPIATTTPNAFDAPVAEGEPTDTAGRGEILLPGDTRVYVRAWDPTFEWFANNFFDVPPGGGTETPLMRIVMVRGASLDAVLMNPDGTPARNTNVGLMMFHPTKGAWWPAEADTDASGAVHFPALPAGAYTIKLKTLEGGSIDLPDVALSPGGHTDLGIVTLR